ncbi:MAG: HAMP domain-containing histidine kinase [Sulfurovum sp.]|nr:HAMP domain-containing histidine kinase [Sulfurovum sp.]
MSIYNKIRIIFLVTALFTTAFFGLFFYVQKNENFQLLRKKHMRTALYVNRHFGQSRQQSTQETLNDPNLKLFLDESDLAVVKKRKRIKNILKNAKVVFKRKKRAHITKILRSKGNIFLYIKNPKYEILLKDAHHMHMPWKVLFWYIAALMLLSLLYLWLTRSLMPLKKLHMQIQEVVQGDLSVSVKSNKNDEIAQVANSFDDALRKLESLINSRQLFLRSIMHELKTPIAKGRLLNEFLENNKHQEGYNAIFERLELLISEFSKIEQMLSSSYELKLANYNAVDIVEQALELMILSDEEMKQKIKLEAKGEYIINTDFDLLSLAIKNLIDNAIKYSPNHYAIITIDTAGITISNTGAKFTDSLEPYLKPFHNQNHGLGLGLYIVQSIIRMLSLDIKYYHKDDKSSFVISSS